MVDLNIMSASFLLVFLAQSSTSLTMEALNLRYMKRYADRIPDALMGFIDSEKLVRINSYSADNSHLFMVRKVVVDLTLLGLIASGILWSTDLIPAIVQLDYFARGIIFFLCVGFIFFVLELPFDYFQTFVIEEKYGFNQSTVTTWVLDTMKGTLLSVVLLIMLLIPVLWAIRAFPNSWWFWAFLIVSAFQFILVVLYPVLIAPIFNKFRLLEDKDLAQKTEDLVTKVGMKPDGVYEMDAGRRSTHSNAYFTGLGRTKRIVLFDTLLSSHTHEEILAVLAHEIGHAKLRHVVKSYLLGQAVLILGFFLTHALMNWDLLYQTFGFDPSQPYVALFLIGVFWQKIGYFISPLPLGLSRRFERQADTFAAELQQSTTPLSDALKKMAGHNLSNLNPHPLYVCFRYSHPPIPERLSLLKAISEVNAPTSLAATGVTSIGNTG
jgi:STE24 endopeptidase